MIVHVLYWLCIWGAARYRERKFGVREGLVVFGAGQGAPSDSEERKPLTRPAVVSNEWDGFNSRGAVSPGRSTNARMGGH